MRQIWLLLAAATAMLSSPAAALCYYDGKFDVRTSIQQEFADSQLVVRVRVLSAIDGKIARGPDAGMDYTVYRLQLIQAYKGRPPNGLRFATERNSGGFYLDRPWVPLPKGHDIGGEYLLFLDPVTPFHGQPAATKGAFEINYNCGQSKRWSDVSKPSRRLLTKLSNKR